MTVASTTGFEDTPALASRPFRASAAMSAPAGFLKNTTQGACAGLLTLAGATQLAGPAAAAPNAATLAGWSLETVGTQLVMGNLTGLLQIIGAAALFLTAGRGMARVFGLMVFVAAAVAYFNGVDVQDIALRTQDLYQALGPAYEAFQLSLMDA